MNDDDPVQLLAALKAEHRRLDDQIRALSSEPTGDQLEIARLKRQKLMLKDEIQRLMDSSVPDIIARRVAIVPNRDMVIVQPGGRRARGFAAAVNGGTLAPMD